MDGHRLFATSNLDAMLKRRERSRRWLARKIGVSTTLMHYIVSGERSISPEKARLVAALLGEGVDDLDSFFVSTSVIKLDAQSNSLQQKEPVAA